MIVGLGHVNRDLVAVVPHLQPGEKVAATAYFEQVGGPVPVALATMARLGLPEPPLFLGVIGDDPEGRQIAAELTEAGVDTSGFHYATGVATSRSLVLIDSRDGSRTLANYAEILPPLSLTPSHRDLLSLARLLHLDGRDLPASLEAARIVRAAGGIVSLDLGTMRPGREELVALCDIVIASKKGAAGAFPEIADNPAEQTARFLQMGARIAGVTVGEHGVYFQEKDGPPRHIPAFPTPEAVDTCGAGDIFHGAFLWAISAGYDTSEVIRFAAAAAALRVRRYGNREGMPTRENVNRLALRSPSPR